MSLKLDQVGVNYRNRQLFSAVTLSIDCGEIATVMGPSGCGKSTLLAAIAGNLEYGFSVEGTITLSGRSLLGVSMEKRRVGMLFQDDMLFPHFDVFGNLCFGLAGRLDSSTKRDRIMTALARAGLEPFAHRDVATLSGGQKARVSLLRTILAQPEAVLLDEPFSKLDKPLRASFRDFVHEQVKEQGIPALLVTHDEADSCGGKIIQLAGAGNNDVG